ncbi:hypothetical protein [Aliiglaciecola sp. M165]|uniref:hypothetical protein n=1 Tax=Aliiglaciecola sp. M165 TaxID=2593649 RepID=UPI00117DB448|nr:hypothetical protein [Aliiglaciecola sp. M165]TRY32914.1 hypothetical protein FM019_02690 [Aliiglaciecola sp. M165]
MKFKPLVALVFSIYAFSTSVANSQTSGLQPPLLSDAQSAIKSAPDESLKMFEQIRPNLAQYSTESQIAWYKVAIESANALLKMEDSYALTKEMYHSFWQTASNQTKQFIGAQFGRYGSINGDLANASTLFICALNYSDDESSRLRSLNNLAIVYIQSGEWEKAKETYLTGIELAKTTNNQRVLAAMNNNLGHIWFEKKDTVKAQEAFKTAYVIKTRLGQHSSRLLSLHNLMQSILLLKDWAQWDLYFPLYQRLANEYQIAEVIAQKQWMEAYRLWATEQNLPDEQSQQDLIRKAQEIENPSSIDFVNDLASKMNLPNPVDTQPQQAKASASIEFLKEVSTVCSSETTGE